jgi:tRNA modification GTPase
MNLAAEGDATIYALASGGGKAAVAIIRISGPEVSCLLREMTGGLPPPRVATLRSIVDPMSREVIDRGLVLWFPAPNSFTGEDCAELQIHGSRATIMAVLRILATSRKARMASPGEFARRALANGKLDLIGVEALADLMDAETEQQRRLATFAASGSLQIEVSNLRERIVDLMAVIEIELDFADEGDQPFDAVDEILRRLPEIKQRLEALRINQDRAERIREGLTVLIAGPPNAGKSSLLNGLAKRDVAIVSEHAGTTRDLIEVKLDLGGFPINLVDSAGIRNSLDPVEREGINRALARSETADLVLWLVPCHSTNIEPPDELLKRPLWRVATKMDLSSEPLKARLTSGDGGRVFPISIKTGHNIGRLLDRLQDFAAENMTVTAGAAVLANERQRQSVEMALAALVDAGQRNRPVEILAEDLRRACFALESLIGKVGVEDVLDSLFARFCIGK